VGFNSNSNMLGDQLGYLEYKEGFWHRKLNFITKFRDL